MDLSELTYDTFAGRIGEAFVDSASGTAFELVQVDDLSERAGPGRQGRAPFSLVFRTPDEPAPQQGIRPLAHDDLGDLEVFLVPVAREADGLRYQAIFT